MIVLVQNLAKPNNRGVPAPLGKRGLEEAIHLLGITLVKGDRSKIARASRRGQDTGRA